MARGKNKEELTYTPEELLDKIREMALILNRPPKKKEFPYAREAQDIWGTWNQVLQAAGCLSGSVRMSEEEIYDAYVKKKKELGRRPKASEFKPYYQIIYRRYGSWYKWLMLIGDEKETSRENLIIELQQFYTKHGRSPEIGETKHSITIQKKLGNGSWLNALQEAGLPLTNEAQRREQINDTRMLLKLIREKEKELGRAPTAREIPESSTIIRRFGSWKNALICADIKIKHRSYNRQIKISDQELLMMVQDLIKATPNRDPYYREFNHAGLCVKRFGKWSKTLDLAKEDPYKTLNQSK